MALFYLFAYKSNVSPDNMVSHPGEKKKKHLLKHVVEVKYFTMEEQNCHKRAKEI